MGEDWQLRVKIRELQTSIDTAISKIKAKLTRKSISYSADDNLRQLISMIPKRRLTPIALGYNFYAHTAVKINDNQVLLGGGSNTSTVHVLYNVDAGVFVTKANLPVTMMYHAADYCISTNWIMYCGGTGNSSCNYQYVLSSNTFVTKASMPQARAYHTLVATDSFLLISGGYSSGDLSTQHVFNVSPNTYTQKANMHTSTDYHAAAWINSNVVLLNGGNDSNNRTANWTFDVRGNTNTVRTALPVARWRHASRRFGTSKVLLMGGTDNTSTDAQVFNNTGNAFVTKRATPAIFNYHTMVDIGDDYLISGGVNTGNKQYGYNVTDNNYVANV